MTMIIKAMVRKADPKEDKIYAKPIDQLEAFKFNAQVADVFQNMIERSIPGYHLILDIIGLTTEHFAQSNTHCYDLGCSLGASTLKMGQHLPMSCMAIGIDNSSDMVERCKANVARDQSQAKIEIRHEDLRTTIIENASVVVMNFTLQFIPEADRDNILKGIADGLVDGGVFLLCEKIKFGNDAQQALFEDLHLSFKRLMGYSDLEIAQKRAALENVLIPSTITELHECASRAGFSRTELIIQCLNFVAILAIK